MRPAPRQRPRRTTLWPQDRLAVALLATLVAVATAVVGGFVGPDWATAVGGLYVALTVFAVLLPAALPFQVATGLVLAASTLVEDQTSGRAPFADVDAGSGTGTVLAVLPIVVGVVATAELLGLAAQLGIVVPRNPSAGLARVAVVTVVAATASGLSLAIGALDGPSGLGATVLAVLGCLGVVALLLRPAASG